MCDVFSQLSDGFYSQFNLSVSQLKTLTKSKNWDILAHSSAENALYIELYNLRFRSAISAIVFQALAVEAYINFYGVSKIGEENYYKDYEKSTSTKDKLKNISKNIFNKDFPTQNKDYENFILLFKKRDTLVHYKTKGFDISNSSDNEFSQNFQNQIGFVYKNIDNIMSVYTSIKRILSELDETNIDLISAEKSKSNDLIQSNILEMLNKSFGV